MQVYVELAIAENFCMDFTLLYAAKVTSKNAVKTWRLTLGGAAGAAFAVLFPLIKTPAWVAVILKILCGLLICLLSGKFIKVRQYVKFTGIFFIYTALLGGAIIGVFSLLNAPYMAGNGYIISSVPIGIPLFFALFIIIGAKRLCKLLTKSHKNAVNCRIYAGQSSVSLSGFFDSGNKVYSRGSPVSVIPLDAAEKLIDRTSIKNRVKIHTVAGSKTLEVFTADKIEIDFGRKTETVRDVELAISLDRLDCLVLHPDVLEGLNV